MYEHFFKTEKNKTSKKEVQQNCYNKEPKV